MSLEDDDWKVVKTLFLLPSLGIKAFYFTSLNCAGGMPCAISAMCSWHIADIWKR